MRTRKEIFDILVTEKERVASLATLTDDKSLSDSLQDMDVNTSSKVGVWRLWLYVVSYALWLQEEIFGIHKEEVEALVASSKVHTSQWYAEQILKYQHGDTLLLNTETKQPYYAVIDESKRVVSNVAVTGSGIALVKVKGESGQLSTAEETGLTGYLREIQEPGAQLSIVNLASDKMQLEAKVYHKPSFNSTTVQSTVQASIIAYLESLPFNGRLQVSDMVEHIKLIEGVNDFYITLMKAKADAAANFAEVEERYYPISGWIELDSITLTMIADV